MAAADQLDRSGAGDCLPELPRARPLAAFLRREADVAAQLAESIQSHHLETVEVALANYRVRNTLRMVCAAPGRAARGAHRRWWMARAKMTLVGWQHARSRRRE